MQTSENAAMKTKFGLAEGQSGGMIVTKVVEMSSSEGILAVGDVITTIGGQDVGEDGSVSFRGFERISLVNEVTSCRPGDDLPLSIVRDGEKLEVVVRV